MRERDGLPVPVPVGLGSYELDPCEGARVIDDVRRGVDAMLDQPREAPMERWEELVLVADKPSTGVLGGGSRSLVSVDFRRGFGPRLDPVGPVAAGALGRSGAISRAF
jgi:hypothetical protein